MSKRLKKIFLKSSVFLFPTIVIVVSIYVTLLMILDITFYSYYLIAGSFVFGVLFWIYALYLKTLYRFYFVSSFLLQLGGLLSVYELGFLQHPFRTLWPFFMIFISVSFLISGFAKHKKLRPSNIVVSFTFFVLGIIFLLFSTKFIQISFVSFALIALPLFFIPSLLTFIFWLYRNRVARVHKNE